MKVQAESFHLNGHIIGFRPDSKVRVTLQNSIKHSGSERVKVHFVFGACSLAKIWTPFDQFQYVKIHTWLRGLEE